MILPPALKPWGPPSNRNYVGTRPTCGPFLILPSALKRLGPPTLWGLCSHPAHLWNTPRSQAVGTPNLVGVM